MNMVREEEFKIAKENRRKRQEAEEGAMIVHLPPSLVPHRRKRKTRDKEISDIVKKIRKKH